MADILDFCRRHQFLVSSVVVAGAGWLALRRYFSGGVCHSKASLNGKTVIVTGGNTGIGKETARDLARRGARVILACRDITKAERAAEHIISTTGNHDVAVYNLDLASLESVRRFCHQVLAREKQLHVLINNAGVMWCPEQWRSEDGYEMQFAVNHLGHFLLTNLLLDLLKASAPSRIVTVSSLAHRELDLDLEDLNQEKDYNPFKAYNSSKLANVLFAKELHRKLEGTGVSSFSLHPGIIRTELGRYAKQVLPYHQVAIFNFLSPLFAKTPVQGAQTSIHCAVTEGLEKHSGKYFSDCEVSKPSLQADHGDVACKLWDISEKMVNLNKLG